MSEGFFLYLAAIVATTFVGGIVPLLSRWTDRSLLIPVSFSGGILLGTAFFHMIPESAAILNGSLGWPLIAGFMIIFSLERFILIHPSPEGAGEHGTAHHIHVGAAAYLGMSFHSLLDGLAVSSAYARPDLGPVVLLAVIFHKMPDAFALASLMLLDKWPRRAVAAWMFGFSLITPAGAILSWLMLREASSGLVGGAIALSAGTFLAVATSDVLPQIRRYDPQRLWPLIVLVVGLAVSWLGGLIPG